MEDGVVEDLLAAGMRLDDLPHPEALAAGGG